jgi:hypothetical protein
MKVTEFMLKKIKDHKKRDSMLIDEGALADVPKAMD